MSWDDDYFHRGQWDRLFDEHHWTDLRPALHADTAKRIDPCCAPLREVRQSVNAPAPPSRSVVEPAPLSFALATTDGVPMPGIDVTIRGPGVEQEATTDDAGVVELVMPAEGIYEVAFRELPLVPPKIPAEPTAAPIYTRKLARDCPGFEVGTGARREILIVRPAFTEVIVDGYAQRASVLRWGGMRPRVDGTVGTARGALRMALWLGRGRTMCVTGHADPLGMDSDNEALSEKRAKSLQLFASGELDAWAEHAFGNAGETDFACAMAACSRILGLGPVSLEDEEAIDQAHAQLRLHAGLADDAPISAADWRAIADVYELDLAALLMTDLAGLAEIRRTITWTDPGFVALGERHPRPAPELADSAEFIVLAHRRCGLCIFGASDAPQLAVDAKGDELYDGTYCRTSLSAPGEVLVDIAVDTAARESISRGRAWIAVGNLGVFEHRAGLDGHVRFMTLRGDGIEVVAAFDSKGRGTMVAVGTVE